MSTDSWAQAVDEQEAAAESVTLSASRTALWRSVLSGHWAYASAG